MSLLTQAAISDLWFAYVNFNHENAGSDIRNVATDFISTLEELEVKGLGEIDEEWLIIEYQERM
jgi:hypothetical protein